MLPDRSQSLTPSSPKKGSFSVGVATSGLNSALQTLPVALSSSYCCFQACIVIAPHTHTRDVQMLPCEKGLVDGHLDTTETSCVASIEHGGDRSLSSMERDAYIRARLSSDERVVVNLLTNAKKVTVSKRMSLPRVRLPGALATLLRLAVRPNRDR